MNTSLTDDANDSLLPDSPLSGSGNAYIISDRLLTRAEHGLAEVDQLLAGSTFHYGISVVLETHVHGRTTRRTTIPADMYYTVATSSLSPGLPRLQDYSPPPQSVPEMLGTIRAAFSLSISDLARVLQVRRPTTYAWMRAETQPRQNRLERLTEIWRLASLWLDLANRPLGDDGNIPVVGGRSLKDLLTDDSLRTELLQNQMRRLAERKRSAPQRGRGGRHMAQILGREGPIPDAEEQIAFESGRPTTLE